MTTWTRYVLKTKDARAIREALDYDAHTGLLRWRHSRRGTARGAVAGTLKTHGYIVVTVGGVPYRAHHLAWLLSYGVWPYSCIDHIDGNPSNNRLENLRPCTQAENLQNLTTRTSNTSGHPGVDFVKSRNQWRARLGLNGKSISLGYFSSLEEALSARLEGKAKLHSFHPQEARPREKSV